VRGKLTQFFLVKICSIFNHFSTTYENILKPNLMHPYSSRTFQRYQEYDNMHCDFKDFNIINKTNKVTSFINIFSFAKFWFFDRNYFWTFEHFWKLYIIIPSLVRHIFCPCQNFWKIFTYLPKTPKKKNYKHNSFII
jgi:hypothetical protein